MNKPTKLLLAVLVAVMGVIVMLPEQSNYFKTAIYLVAQEHDMSEDQLQLQSGHYKNFMLFKTVEVNLNYAQSQKIRAVIKQTPWTDWTLSVYELVTVN